MLLDRRSLYKALTWRVMSSALTGVIVYAATGSATWGTVWGAVDAILKVGMYYAHERVWERVPVG